MMAVKTMAAGASGVRTKPPPATMPSMTPAIRICADGAPSGKIVQGSKAHKADRMAAWIALLRTAPGLTRVGRFPRWRSQPASPSVHSAQTAPHQAQRSHGATAAGSVSASKVALATLTTISHGETKVTHCTRRARISADSVSRLR